MKNNKRQASLSLFLLLFVIVLALILNGGLVVGVGCDYLLAGKSTAKQSVVKNAMNAVLPRWTGSTDVDGFKMDVVAYLNSNGQVAARGWNGNCNPSPNNLAIQTSMVNGVMMGEMYEIARDNAGCRDEPNPTLGQSTPCRPVEGYVGPWSYMSTGIKPGGGGGGTGTGSGLTFFGQAKYLVFISYFDALRASDSTLDSDFAYLTSKGIGGIRIFPNWWKGFDYSNVPGDTLMDSSGNLRAAQLSELKNVLNKAQARGLVVDVSFAKETAGLENNFAAYKRGTEAATRELTSYRNVLFDLQNEYDLAGRGTYLTVSQVKALRNAVKAIDPSRIVTASTTDTTGETGTISAANQENLDVISYHDPRGRGWYSRTGSVVNTLVASGKPAYLQEPESWVGDSSLTGQNFITAATQAKSAGAAAWTFHTESGFDLRSSSLQSQLSSAERNFLDSLSSALSSTTWGATSGGGGGGDGGVGGRSCGQGQYFSKLEGFDYQDFNDCSKQSPKNKAGRVFSNFATVKVTQEVINKLNEAGLGATLVAGTQDVINFNVVADGNNVGRVDVIKGMVDATGIGQKWQWLPLAGSDGYHTSGECNAPTGTLPQVDSINPTTLGSGTILTINGEFLTHTIQFYGDNGRNSYIGAVNSDCSKSTINVPSDLPSGTYTVKIYKARDKISNGKAITITGSGGGGSGSSGGIATPLSVWSPKLTINGWFPQISPDGRYVTYGFGENWVVDLQTGEERSFTQATGQSFAGQWINPNTLTFINFISQRDNTADRYEVKVGEWIAKRTNDDPALVAGNTFVAADNHWASWIADARNNNFRIAYDNSILATNVYGLAIGYDNWLAFAADNDNSALKVWHNGDVTATYTPQVPLQQWAINRGYVLYGGYGPVHGITPNGQDIDLTVASWRWEGVGGIIFVEDMPWVFTSSWDEANNKGYVFIRPWGERNGIAVEAEAAGLDVKYADGKFIVAANGDRGQLKVITVSANAQRVDLTTGTVTEGGGNGGSATPTNPIEILPGWQGDLAYNPINNNWLAVSKDTGGDYDSVITGKIVGNNGAGVTQQFRISQINPIIRSGTPRVAFSSRTNKYLVVWATDAAAAASPGQIFGRFVSADGQLSGQPFLITGSLSGINEISGKLKYDSKINKFVLAVNNAGSTTVKLVTIGTDGAVGNFITISPQTGHRFSSNIATNPNAGEYCIIYLAQRSDAEFTQVFVKKVDISTGTVGQEYEVSQHTSGHVSAPSIDYDLDSNKYLAVWSRYGGDGTKGRFLTGCTPTGNEINIKQSMNLPSIYYNVNSKLYGIIGEVTENANSLHVNRGEENYYLFVNPSGSIIDGGKIFTDFGPTGNKLPMIAANTQDGTFAAISSKDYGMTRFVAGIGRSLAQGTSGTGIGGSISWQIVGQTDLGNAGVFPDPVWFNDELYVTVDKRANGKIDIYKASNPDLSDLTVWKTIPIGANGGPFPRLTVYNNVLWMAYRSGDPNHEARLWRSDTEAIESFGASGGNDPVAAENGYVAWQDNSFNIYRRRLDGGPTENVRYGAPTGISRILNDGRITTIDEDRLAVPGYTRPWWAGDLVVVEGKDTGAAGFFGNNYNSPAFTLWGGQTAHTPHAAANGRGLYAVATWNPTVRIAVVRKSSTT